MHTTYRSVAGRGTRVLSVDGSGTPILLLHGFSDHASSWQLLLGALEQQGHRAIAVDLPGFGAADALRDGPLLPQLSEFVAETIQMIARDHGPPVVVGNSLGGLALWLAAQQHQPPIGGIVTIAPAGFGYTMTLRRLKRLNRTGGLARVPLPIPMTLLRHLALQVFTWAVGPGGTLAAPIGTDWARQFRSRDDVRALLALASQVLAEVDDMRSAELPPYPTLMVWGDNDRLVAQPAAGMLTDAEHVLLRGGHCPQIRQPHELLAHLLDFEARALPEPDAA